MEDDDVVIESTTDPLIYRSSKRWCNAGNCDNGGRIPVCFSSAGNGGPLDRQRIQDLAFSTWERVADVKFTGWQTCPAGNALSPDRVVITIRGNLRDPETNERYLTESSIGKNAGNKFDFDPQANSDGVHTDGQWSLRSSGDVVHELGHLLGFLHEHQHMQAPPDCGGDDDPYVGRQPDWRGAYRYSDLVYAGPAFDRESIMSYCKNEADYVQWQIDDTDVRGVRMAYGARKTSLGVFESSTGKWAIDNNDNHVWNGAAGGDRDFTYGYNNHYPLASTGYIDPIVGYFFAGGWKFDTTAPTQVVNAGDAEYSFGVSGNIPVLGYWQGRQTYSRLGVFNPYNATWALDMNANGVWENAPNDRLCYFGAAGDQPAPGNFPGMPTDRDVIAVFRNGDWYIDRDDSCSWTAGDSRHSFGQAGDIPVPGDYDGDGKDNLAVYRPSEAKWYFDQDSSMSWTGGDQVWQFGSAGVRPLAVRRQ